MKGMLKLEVKLLFVLLKDITRHIQETGVTSVD